MAKKISLAAEKRKIIEDLCHMGAGMEITYLETDIGRKFTDKELAGEATSLTKMADRINNYLHQKNLHKVRMAIRKKAAK